MTPDRIEDLERWHAQARADVALWLQALRRQHVARSWMRGARLARILFDTRGPVDL